jgi:hypothetical protein
MQIYPGWVVFIRASFPGHTGPVAARILPERALCLALSRLFCLFTRYKT